MTINRHLAAIAVSIIALTAASEASEQSTCSYCKANQAPLNGQGNPNCNGSFCNGCRAHLPNNNYNPYQQALPTVNYYNSPAPAPVGYNYPSPAPVGYNYPASGPTNLLSSYNPAKLRFLVGVAGKLQRGWSSVRASQANTKTDAFTGINQYGIGGFFGLAYTNSANLYLSAGISSVYLMEESWKDKSGPSFEATKNYAKNGLKPELQLIPEISVGYAFVAESSQIIPLVGMQATIRMEKDLSKSEEDREWEFSKNYIIFSPFAGVRFVFADAIFVEAAASLDINKTEPVLNRGIFTRNWGINLKIGASF
jgi:hypothetical protein